MTLLLFIIIVLIFKCLSTLLISLAVTFVCAVATGTFVMAPAELGEPARIRRPLHRGADLAQ